jgi:hypothetical protein
MVTGGAEQPKPRPVQPKRAQRVSVTLSLELRAHNLPHAVPILWLP